jgi:DNA modification methylase
MVELSQIVVARKPVEGIQVENLLKYGTGCYNIDECRLPNTGERLGGGGETVASFHKKEGWDRPWMHDEDKVKKHKEKIKANVERASSLGRWPSNVIHDGSEDIIKLFPDRCSGKSNGNALIGVSGKNIPLRRGKLIPRFDSGSAARFFYDISKYKKSSKKVDMNQTYKIINNDCLDAMRLIESNSIDSIVTDPPYGLSFMGKKWDHGVPGIEFWIEALRILKPGGHLLAFGGARTYHRLACAIEDAGFEIRDCVMWLYATGMPHSMNMSKEIDKRLGAERDIIGKTSGSGFTKSNVTQGAQNRNVTEWNIYSDDPITESAKQWEGWGTNLKPAHEPIIVASKENIPNEDNTALDNMNRFYFSGKTSKKDRAEYNNHPTVKPTELMRYLCKLVTPKNGLILDPFCGSGSTGKGAILEGFSFIGIELDPDYAKIAEQRISEVFNQPLKDDLDLINYVDETESFDSF